MNAAPFPGFDTLPPDVTLIDCFPGPEATYLFHQLRNEIEWRQEEIKIYGRRMPLPRLTAWYGDPEAHYRNSGIEHRLTLWTTPLLSIREVVQMRVLTTFVGKPPLSLTDLSYRLTRSNCGRLK